MTYRQTTPRVIASAAAALLALTAAACGTGSSSPRVAAKTVSAAQWNTAVCGSIGRYGKATEHPLLVFQGLHLEFKYGLPKQSEVRQKQIGASQSIVIATDRLITELEAAGTPRTTHGRAFANELVASFQELRDSVDQIHDQATALPTGTGQADKDSELSPEIGAALEEFGKRADANRKTNGAGLNLRCGAS
jgi:hypothetical protein